MQFKHIVLLIDAMDLLFHDDIQSFLKAIVYLKGLVHRPCFSH